MVKLCNDWDDILADEFQSEYYLRLREFLKSEYRNFRIYPPMDFIFSALKLTPYKDVKCVILGQDPYINENEAHGLCFSVNEGVKIPPSLLNIYKEIVTDVGGVMPQHGNLLKWANEGVLLLNTTLTVRAKSSNSHKGKGWELLTDKIIRVLNDKAEPVVFLLWGNHAKAKAGFITNDRHLVLTAAHPSPLAGGAFFGCKHFSKTNAFLEQNGIAAIDWQIN